MPKINNMTEIEFSSEKEGAVGAIIVAAGKGSRMGLG